MSIVNRYETEIVERSGELVGGMEGFQGSAADVGSLANHVGTAAAVAREEGEIKAAITLARFAPRQEMAAYTRIMNACKRPRFADNALYCFPRGGKDIEGPSVKLAREMARCWGNIRSGIRIVSMDKDYVHVKGYAYDLETNSYKESEAKFRRLIQRKDKRGGETRWVEPDERDLRELVNKHGAFCERNAILQSLPPDFTEDAMNAANETLRAEANKQLKSNPAEVVKKMVLGFNELGVTVEMIAARLGHSLENIDASELADLRGVYASIRDGNSKREEHFDIGSAEAPRSRTAEVIDRIKGQQSKETTGEAPETASPSAPAAPVAEPAQERPEEPAPGESLGGADAQPPADFKRRGTPVPPSQRRNSAPKGNIFGGGQ